MVDPIAAVLVRAEGVLSRAGGHAGLVFVGCTSSAPERGWTDSSGPRCDWGSTADNLLRSYSRANNVDGTLGTHDSAASSIEG